MTPIGLGLAALGRPGYINLGHARDLGGRLGVETMRAGAHAVLDAAYDAGVRYFDAARSYGRVRRSSWARWLRERPASSLPEVERRLEVGLYLHGRTGSVDAEVPRGQGPRSRHCASQYAETRHDLGADLGLYQIHSATLESGVLE